MLLQHTQVLRSAALCLVPSALADPQLVPLSVPKLHSPSWDKRWKASWEWTASVTGWPDMGLRDSWTGGLSSVDRGTKRRTSLHFCVSSLVLVLFFSPSLPPPLPQQLHGRQRRAVLEANISINNANGQTVRGHPVLQCAHRSDFTNPRCPQFGPTAIKDIFT